MTDARSRGSWIILLAVLSLIAALFAAGCSETDAGKTREPAEEREEDGKETSPEGDMTVTLYFRYTAQSEEFLAPEERVIPATPGVARAAMERLIEGPEPGSGLAPVLPDSVKIIDIGVEDGLCTVDVSKQIITDSSSLAYGARGEQLALASIANTLTEIEGIERVKLLVEGAQSGEVDGRLIEDFWGHVGLPDYLERDESIIYREAS